MSRITSRTASFRRPPLACNLIGLNSAFSAKRDKIVSQNLVTACGESMTEFYRRKLPHWQPEGAMYFVTFRLTDSLPGLVIQEKGFCSSEAAAKTPDKALPASPLRRGRSRPGG
ncbi:MAG: hypothetical protein N2204_00835 [Anaerolineae bacterium]|nr:hypothetical protein [Anaerolineae bacterium]